MCVCGCACVRACVRVVWDGRELKRFDGEIMIDFLVFCKYFCTIEYACEATRIKISTTSLSTRFFEKKQLERATEFLYHAHVRT